MGLVDAHALYLLSSRERGLPIVPSLLPRQVADSGAEFLACTREAPDPAYWTAYDYYMIERDAQAMRRAEVCSMIAVLGNRLLQHFLSSVRGLKSAAALTIRRRGAASR